MPDKPFTIQPFRELPENAEILGIGLVVQSSGPAIEPLFEVLLANGLEGPGPVQCATSRVGCGQMDLLTVGSRWTKGRHIGDGTVTAVTATVAFRADRALGSGVDQPDRGIRRFPSATIAAAPCYLVQLESAEASGRTPPQYAMVPVTELVRALFGVSSPFLQQLIDGLRDGRVMTDRAFVDRSRSGRSPTDNSRVVLWCERKLSKREAVLMASVLTDERLRRSHDSVFQQLSVNGDWRDGRPVWLTMEWPFSEPLRWSFEGRWYQTEKGKSFLVTRITAIDLPITFETIDMHHPGPETGPANPDMPFPSARLQFSGGRVAALTTGMPSSPSRRPTSISSRDVEMSAAEGVKVRAIAHGGPARPPAAGLGEEPRAEALVSTAGRWAGADPGVGRAVVTRTTGNEPADDRSNAEALDATLAALRIMACQVGWTLTYFPIHHRAEGKPSDPFDFLEDMLLVEVETPDGFVIVADMGSSLGSQRSLGLLVRADRGNLDQTGAKSIREAGHRLGGSWGRRGAEVRGFILTRAHRPASAWTDSSAYAALLARKIRSALRDGQGV